MNPIFNGECRMFFGRFLGWNRDSGCFCIRFQFRLAKYKMNFWIRDVGGLLSGESASGSGFISFSVYLDFSSGISDKDLFVSTGVSVSDPSGSFVPKSDEILSVSGIGVMIWRYTLFYSTTQFPVYLVQCG